MNTVNLKEARKRLGGLVKIVEHGETIAITRRGRQVARLVPVPAESAGRLPDLKKFRAAIKVKGAGLTKELLDMRNEERG